LIPALLQGDLDLVVGRLPEYRYQEGKVPSVLLSKRRARTAWARIG
jgi:hypothetical protein